VNIESYGKTTSGGEMSEWNEELTALSDGYAAKVEENAYFQACSEVLQLRAELARRDVRIAELEAMINPASFDKYLVG
jgi:hypothetical protein